MTEITKLNELKQAIQSNIIQKLESITKDDITNYYIPLLLIIILFWPIVATLFIAISSASLWLFWILTSIVFGIIQLLYVSYQFLMVSLDIMGLCFLKTYAIIRSLTRHYSTIIGIRRGRGKKKKLVVSRKRFKQALNNAKSFNEFEQIEILEPLQIEKKGDGNNNVSNKRWNILHMLRWLEKFSKQNFNKTSSSSSSSSTNHKKKKRKSLRNSQSCLNLSSALTNDKSDNDNDKLTPIKHSKSQEFKKNDNSSSSHDSSQLGISGDMLIATTSRLREARIQAIDADDTNGDYTNNTQNNIDCSFSSLKFLLSAVVKRNHCSVDDYLIDDARSIAESGAHYLTYNNRNIINDFMNEVEDCLQYISIPSTPTSFTNREQLDSRIDLLQKIKQNTGCTALMLSGGGAQSMYHLGSIRGLIESGLYDDIKVISGTSGGSITAGMCAMHTSEYLLKNVCVDYVSTDYKRTGEMQRKNIRWFPKFVDMGLYWLEKKLLVNGKDFRKCCDFYYSKVTFEEAYLRTGKHVCITVTASRTGSSQRLLLNHISTPHVTISSAVAASCALPGVMAPAKLEMKLKDDTIEPFEVDGTEWVDGSIQADLPFKRISTLFNVSNFIVCQVNFHVVPFLNKAHHPSTTSLYWRLFQVMEWDIRSRVLNLSRLGLFPTIFGQNVSKVFKQKYHGNLTIVPRFTRTQVFGLQVLVNPSVEDMKVYLQNGQSATWVNCHVIHHMVRFEKAVNIAIDRLKSQLSELTMNESLHGGSIHNKSFRSMSATDDEKILLEYKVNMLEEEVKSLKFKLKKLEEQVVESSVSQNGYHDIKNENHHSLSSSESADDGVNHNENTSKPVDELSHTKDGESKGKNSGQQQWTQVTRSRSKKCLLTTSI